MIISRGLSLNLVFVERFSVCAGGRYFRLVKDDVQASKNTLSINSRLTGKRQ